jgi:hypothetical protein
MEPSAVAQNFAPPAYVSVDEAPVEILAADLNGDGAPDLVTMSEAGEVGPSLSLLLNSGNGRFTEEDRLFIDRLRHVPHGLAAAGLSDSGVDLFVAADDIASFPPRSAILHFVNEDGAGDFLDPVAIPLDGSFPSCLVATELNGDGIPDLVLCHVGPASAGQVTILVSHVGQALSRVIDVRAGISPRGVATGDLDGDGYTDVLVVDAIRGAVFAIFGTGGSELLGPAVQIASIESPVVAAIVPRPFDLPSVLIASESSGVHELRQPQRRSFLPPRSVTTVAGSRMAVADMNGDSALDFALLRPTVSSLSIWRGSGMGDYQLASSMPIDVRSEAMAIADFDLNGLADVAVVSSAKDRVAIFRQQPAPSATPTRTPTPLPTPGMAGDANCDGKITTHDIDAVVENIFRARCAGADANADGGYTAADVPALATMLSVSE